MRATKKNRNEQEEQGRRKEGEKVRKKNFSGAHVTSGLAYSAVIQVSIYKEGKRRYRLCTRCPEEMCRPTSAAASRSIWVENNKDQNHRGGNDGVGKNANSGAK